MRLGKFVTAEELAVVQTALKCSGMFLSGGTPMGDPCDEVRRLCEQYGMPVGTGLDTSNGEFVTQTEGE